MGMSVTRATLRTLGIVGVALTCPCHAVALLLLVGGGAGAAWLAQHLGVAVASLGPLFLGSLWLLLHSGRRTGGAVEPASRLIRYSA